jgi:hypothetical protein
MYKIGIASTTYLADGGRILTPLPDTDIRGGDRRVSRTKTLDGGVVITDSGFAHGDRTFKINVSPSATLWAFLWSLFQTASVLFVSTDEGCFSAVASDVRDQGDKIALEILVKQKLSA